MSPPSAPPSAPPSRPPASPDTSLWRDHAVPLADPARWSFGPLRVWWCWSANELRVATERKDSEKAALHEEDLEAASVEAEPRPSEDELDWSRWALQQPRSKIRVSPVFPDRPLILSPEDPVHLQPGAQVRFYARVPIWVRLSVAGEDGADLQDLPTVRLSSTWFGSFTDGEVCYFNPTRMRRSLDPRRLGAHLAACPLQIENAGREVLKIEKICLRVQFLTLFEHEGRVWADETRIAFQGGQNHSKILWSGKPPPEVPGARVVAQPRGGAGGWVSAWTFGGFLRSHVGGGR